MSDPVPDLRVGAESAGQGILSPLHVFHSQSKAAGLSGINNVTRPVFPLTRPRPISISPACHFGQLLVQHMSRRITSLVLGLH